MLVPLSWLREFTPYAGSAQTLGDKLTMLGLELEDIVNPFADISGIVVGYVAQCVQHPDSDHLHCCKVDIGSGELLDIVCGAPNVAGGQKVPVAPVGCRLPDGMVIKKAKLRGQPSQGMICSERELGLSDDHSGIMVLPESAETGHKLVDVMNMDCEVLDISITPNRADCLSVLGVARETAMAFHLPFNVPELPLITDDSEPEINIPIKLQAPDLCWLYSGRVISGARVAASPAKIRYRLMAAGIRPISNIVDVTNYILVECGQPLHAFDLDKLAGGSILVRRAHAGERLLTLDGKERILRADDLCICDAEKSVALAGVMGGLNTEITEQTENIFIESAVFKPQNIRGTARRLGMSSEASYRYERGIDQNRAVWALNRASALMVSLCGGIARRGLTCSEPKPFIPARIKYAPARANALLGREVIDKSQHEILESIGCAVENSGDGKWIVAQPSWRPDLTREADLIEEIGRVTGLDTIEPALPPICRAVNDDLKPRSNYDFFRRIKHWGAGVGLNEAINYSFVGQKDLDLLNLPNDRRISILNPLSEEQNVLRTCVAPGILQDLKNNLAFNCQSVRLFEVATIFAADADSETGAAETGWLALILNGLRHETAWPHADREFDYADLKGLVEHLFRFLNLRDIRYNESASHPYLLPCVEMAVADVRVGHMGRLKPELAHEYNAQKPVWMAELNLELLRELHERAAIIFKTLPVYPAVRRDITVMANSRVKADEILGNILSMKMPLLEGAVLVDCFEPVEQNERNLTFRLTFRHSQRTLKDAEVDKEREKVAEHLRKKMGVRI